jgi:hypothetical protein
VSAGKERKVKHRLFASIADVGLVLLSSVGGVAVAQSHDDTVPQQAQAEAYRGREWRMPLFNQVRKDLDHAKAAAVRGSDRGRIDHTVLELTEMQGDLSNYWRNQHELDEILGSLGKVVTQNRLSPQDRDTLNGDLARLRAFREDKNAWR